MATFRAISATGKSIERLLNACFAVDQPVPNRVTRAVLVRSEDFDVTSQASLIAQRRPAMSVFLYRLEQNKTMRASWSAVGSIDGRAHLPLDLHFLLTAWADNAEYELQIMGSALGCIDQTPILSGPLLYPTGDWAPNETIQLVFEEFTTEALQRTFDSLQADFKVSVSLIARIARVDSAQAFPAPPVTTAVTGTRPV